MTRWTYAPEPERTVSVWQENHIFTKRLIAPVFLVLVKLWLIEGFSQIWRTRTFRSFRRCLSIQVSFNSHNAHCYFPCIARLFCVSSKHVYFITLTVYTYCTWTLSFWEKRCAEHVNQVRLVKQHACKIQTRYFASYDMVYWYMQ
jgi:hypothetical protein